MNLEKYDNNLDELASKVAAVMRNGGVVILPFDTVYGFACDPNSDQAIDKIFSLKERPAEKTIGIAVDNMLTMRKIGETEDWGFVAQKIDSPSTFILKSRVFNYSRYCYRGNTIAIRVPNSTIVRSIVKGFGGAIAQTSANKSGQDNCLSLTDLQRQFSKQELDSIDLIIDGGTINEGRPSTIYDLTGDTPKEIER